MLPRNSEQDDTSKSHRTPRNLLDYILHQSLNDDFISLLTKHHKSIEALFKRQMEIPEIEEAMFIVELNKFGADLVKIAKLCAEINMEMRKHQENIEKSRKALEIHDSRALAEMVGSLYKDARTYDEYYQIPDWLPKLNGRPFSKNLILLFNPFRHNPDLPNEENICNLLAAFNVHDDFFKNFLNILYGDGKEGQELLGKTFAAVSSEYKKIKRTITEISKQIPKSAPEQIKKNVNAKRDSLEKIMAKHPASLYLATRNILNHLENTTNTFLNPKPVPLRPPSGI